MALRADHVTQNMADKQDLTADAMIEDVLFLLSTADQTVQPTSGCELFIAASETVRAAIGGLASGQRGIWPFFSVFSKSVKRAGALPDIPCAW